MLLDRATVPPSCRGANIITTRINGYFNLAAMHANLKQFDEAIAHLDHAVRLEDGLVYTEPAEWHFPPRLALGVILLEAGRPAEAETVYWEDLRRNRHNGWALYGLMQALSAQQKNDQAALIEVRFKKAWERADITLNASRLGRPLNLRK